MTDAWELCLDCKDQGGNATVRAPNICILLLTYKRTEMTVRTIKGLAENLDYPKELLSFYVADDGSPWEHMETIFKAIGESGIKLVAHHNQKYRHGTPFCGTGWNMGLQKSHQYADYVMMIEDDWVLRNPMDIRPWIRMLMEREDVGMLRMSGLTTDNIMRVQAHRGVHYFEYLRSGKMCYSGNPHIRHLRFSQYYGLFAIDTTPGDIEIHYDNKFHRLKDGPNIWRPASISEWGVFDHIGQERMW